MAHFPFKNNQLKIGTRCQGFSGLLQCTQWEGGQAIDSPRGRRQIQTLAKLPRIAPRTDNRIATGDDMVLPNLEGVVPARGFMGSERFKFLGKYSKTEGTVYGLLGGIKAIRTNQHQAFMLF